MQNRRWRKEAEQAGDEAEEEEAEEKEDDDEDEAEAEAEEEEEETKRLLPSCCRSKMVAPHSFL